MVTFKVDDVKLGSFKDDYLEPGSNKRTLDSLVGPGVEGSSLAEDNYMVTTHNLVFAVNTAYDKHLPLVLSPDMLWLMISQGLSTHINNNAGELRSQFVNFEGKKELVVEENSFVKGGNNDWPHMFGEFSKQIAGYIGKKRDLIVNGFSTTSPVELAASEVVLMESMSKYFDYTCSTMCGIPTITLLGSVSDWENILTRVRNIAEFNLSWWTKRLEPIAQEFVNAAKGNANKAFWQNIYKEGDDSGGPYISGWMTELFPYLKDYKTNDFTLRNSFETKGHFGGLTTSAMPIGMAKVPFKWLYYTEEFKMELAAGFTGFRMVDGAVTPQVGWFVRDTELMTQLKMTFKRDTDYRKNDELRKNFLAQLSAIGFEEQGYGWGERINGVIPTVNLDKAKQISGLNFSDDKE